MDKVGIPVWRKSKSSGLQHGYSLSYRAVVGRTVEEERVSLLEDCPHAKQPPFIKNALAKLYRPEVLRNADQIKQLKQMAKRAHADFKKGAFKEVAQVDFAKKVRARAPGIYAAAESGDRLYAWYKDLPPQARKTRRAFYNQIKLLNRLNKEECAQTGATPTPIPTDVKKRRQWLTRWAKRHMVSFRKTNRHFKLDAITRTQRLGVFWRDAIRIRRALGEDICFQNWDETPLYYDELRLEETAAPVGKEKVAVSAAAKHARTTTIVSMASKRDYPAAPVAVVFPLATVGTRVRQNVDKELKEKGSAAQNAKHYFTETGNVTTGLMADMHQIQRDNPPPLRRLCLTKEENGWWVSLCDSYASHKKYYADSHDAMLNARCVPLIIPGGLTPDVQPCDGNMNRMIKESIKEEQQKWELEQILSGEAPRPTRAQVLERILTASTSEPVKSLDQVRVFKQMGITLALDGSEDHMLAGSLREPWTSLGMSEWRSTFLADHDQGYATGRLVSAMLETRGASPDDVEPSEDESESSDSDECCSADDEEPPAESSTATGGRAAVLFAQAMSLGGEGSPRLLSQLKRYVDLKSAEKGKKLKTLHVEK